jgi:hypothetical protein
LCRKTFNYFFTPAGNNRLIFLKNVSLIIENMKTLKNHLILFDEECPMCRAYTQAFVRSGMLAKDGRAAYQSELETVCPVIDRQRAVNEIALVNTQNGEITYGVESLFKVIGNACPVFAPLFRFRPFAWLMGKVYAFISSNRRVIIPAGKKESTYAYQPTFKLHYRIAYLLLTWLGTGYILTAYAYLLTGFIPAGGPWREYFICGGQIIFQGTIISAFAREKLWNYLGNMMTISFAGSLLLLLMVGVAHWIKVPQVVLPLYFMGVAGLMFLEHIRRTGLMGLGWVMTVTWVLYRVGLLLVLLK